MDYKYKPDGWLGIIVGTKFWIDFTELHKVDSNVEKLVKELGSRGKIVLGETIQGTECSSQIITVCLCDVLFRLRSFYTIRAPFKWRVILSVVNAIYAIAWEAWKKIQDFNGVWTRDLAKPVGCSNQLSYAGSHWCWELVNYVFICSRERDECDRCIRNKSCKHSCCSLTHTKKFHRRNCCMNLLRGFHSLY